MAEQHRRCRYWPLCIIHVGERRPRRLSSDNVREVRRRRAAGELLTEIARDMHVDVQIVGKVARRQAYRNIGG